MKLPRMFWAGLAAFCLVGAAGLTVLAQPAHASPSPTPTVSVTTPAPSPSSAQASFPTGSYYFFSDRWQSSYWAHSTVNNHWYTSPTNHNTVTIVNESGGWQILKDNSKNNMCFTLNYGGSNNFVDDVTCDASKASELWKSAQDTNCQGACPWILWNDYIVIHDPNVCAGSYIEVLTATGSSADMRSICPDAGTGNPGTDQHFFQTTIAP